MNEKVFPLEPTPTTIRSLGMLLGEAWMREGYTG
jgi:hypothetical protein